VELRELAERVLRSERLEDKLLGADTLSDRAPGPAREVAWPARPEALRLDVERARSPFPGLAQLETPDVAGAVLHFFANHELLALELMALMLLRFPDADPGWRRSLAQTMLDEQRHMRAYLERMEQFGVAFGDRAPSAFFWSVLAGAANPAAFAAGMGLTFEQANLDYCLHYGAAFARIGDVATEAVLREVYEDEVRHVAHALSWHRRWKPDGTSDWEAYAAALEPPLTPARARGRGFSAEARREAGLDEDFVRRVRVFGASKGRHPRVHWFNPGSEPTVAGAEIDAITRTLRRDLETLPMFLAGPDDAVLVSEPPDPGFLNDLRDLGFGIPQFVTQVPERVAGFSPFAHTPESRALLGGGLERDAAYPRSAWSRYTGAQVVDGEQAHALVRSGGGWVFKSELSSTGRGLRFVEGAVDASTQGWLRRQGRINAEPLLARVADLSALYRGSRLLGLSRPLVGPGGRWRGQVVGHPFSGLDPELRRFLGESDVRSIYARLGGEIALEGLWGIDGLIHRTAEGLALREVVEVNPRTTMGHVARALGKTGVFRVVHVSEAARPGRLALTDPRRAERFVAVLDPAGTGSPADP